MPKRSREAAPGQHAASCDQVGPEWTGCTAAPAYRSPAFIEEHACATKLERSNVGRDNARPEWQPERRPGWAMVFALRPLRLHKVPDVYLEALHRLRMMRQVTAHCSDGQRTPGFYFLLHEQGAQSFDVHTEGIHKGKQEDMMQLGDWPRFDCPFSRRHTPSRHTVLSHQMSARARMCDLPCGGVCSSAFAVVGAQLRGHLQGLCCLAGSAGPSGKRRGELRARRDHLPI